MTTRWDAARERNEAAVAARAERVLHDTRYDALRTRRARIALVALLVALIAATPFVWLTGGAIPGLIAVAVAVGALAFVRVSIRVVADLPADVLDERQRSVRDRAYVEAYRWFAGLMIVGACAGLVAVLVNVDDTDTWTVDITWNAAMAVFWPIQLLAMSLPSIVVALGESDEVPIDPHG
jgi:hypothetical protein